MACGKQMKHDLVCNSTFLGHTKLPFVALGNIDIKE